MPNLHPILVHFPIVLLSMAVVFDAASVIFKRDQFEFVGRWTQLTGSISLVAVVLSGLAAKNLVAIPGAGMDFFESHEQTAFVVAALSFSLLLWRISTHLALPPKHKQAYIVLSFLTVVLIWIGAWYGGELVYRFGVGVQSITK